MAQIFKSVPYKLSNKTTNSLFHQNKNPIKLANVYEPTNGFDEMDVIKKFNWTLTPRNETTLKEVPYIKLTEYYLFDSYLNQLFKSYGKSQEVKDLATLFLNPFALNELEGSTQLYQGLYDHANPTGFVYKLPYFSTEYLNTSNSWTAKPMFQEIMNLQKKVIGYGAASIPLLIGGAVLGIDTLLDKVPLGKLKPALGIIKFLKRFGYAQAAAVVARGLLDASKITKEQAERGFELKKLTELLTITTQSPIANMQDPAIDKPHIWSTTAPRSFNITFPLYNTLTQPDSNKWYSNIIQNWELCHLLCYQNLYNKRNLFTGEPPVFYEIDIPGVHYSKAGYVSNLQILNIGNIRKFVLPLDGGNKEVNVPDAYLINMTVTDFFIPSKNFMSSLCSKNKGTLLQSSAEKGIIYKPDD